MKSIKLNTMRAIKLLAVVVLLVGVLQSSAAKRSNEMHGPRESSPTVGSHQFEAMNSNMGQAKARSNPIDLDTAAAHHHHHKHHVHGWLKMGAHSGHKGAFGWHAKYPVGGKGRR